MVFITLKQETTHAGSGAMRGTTGLSPPGFGKHAFSNTTSAASDADNGEGTRDELSALKRRRKWPASVMALLPACSA